MADHQAFVVRHSAFVALDGAVEDVDARCQIISALFGSARENDGTISDRCANLLSVAIYDACEACDRAREAFEALTRQGGARG